MEFTIGRAVAVVVMIMAVACAGVCEASEDTREVEHVCNGATMSLGDMSSAWALAVTEAMDKTPTNGYHYKAQRTVGGATVWAIGACNGRLQQIECTRCMGSALNQLSVCYNQVGIPSIGAQIKLVDCRLRWETVDFDW